MADKTIWNSDGTDGPVLICPPPKASHLDVQALLNRVRDDRYGFFSDKDIKALAEHPDGRLTQVLVRCGGVRFICAAQDVAALTAHVVKGGDYVRDVSLPAKDGR